MRTIIQRVTFARVDVGGKTVGQIGQGLLAYVGVSVDDGPADAVWLGEKVANLRIFEDADGKLNVSVLDKGGSVLAIPHFPLMADGRRGRRPSFTAAARPDQAQPLHEQFVQAVQQQGVPVQAGVFGADMRIASWADGPINISLDSRQPDQPRPQETNDPASRPN